MTAFFSRARDAQDANRPEIDAAEARRRALAALSELGIGPEVVLMDDQTREEDFGWVFFYQSREYVETGDPAKMLVGDAPIIVDRAGDAYVTGTAMPVEHYIDEYREGRLLPLD